MGYWLVLALIVVAGLAVIVAMSGEPLSNNRIRPRTLVVLAASDGTGEGLADPVAESWPMLLAQPSPSPELNVVNLSIAGLTLDRALKEALPSALELRPDRAAIWLVVNDYGFGRPLAAYVADLRTILGAFRNAGVEVFIGNLPDLSSLSFLADVSEDAVQLRADCAIWNQEIAHVAADFDATVLDFFTQPVAPEAVADDGFHPSAEGQRQLAARFREALFAP